MNQSDGVTDGIYSAHMSCILTGYDQWRWTGLFAVDTWFEEECDDPALDKVMRYENDREDGMLFDPLSRGRDEASKSSWHPRLYFIRVMEIRLSQVKREWQKLAYNVEFPIRKSVWTSLYFHGQRFNADI